MTRVLITGGTGFIGVALANRLAIDGHDVITISRNSSELLDRNIQQITNVDLGGEEIQIPDLDKQLPMDVKSLSVKYLSCALI